MSTPEAAEFAIVNSFIDKINSYIGMPRDINDFELSALHRDINNEKISDSIRYLLMGLHASIKVDISQMKRYCEKAISIYPNDPLFYSAYAKSLINLYLYEDALDYAQQGYKKFKMPEFVGLEVDCLIELGRYVEASRKLEQYQNLTKQSDTNFTLMLERAMAMFPQEIEQDFGKLKNTFLSMVVERGFRSLLVEDTEGDIANYKIYINGTPDDAAELTCDFICSAALDDIDPRVLTKSQFQAISESEKHDD